MLLAAAQLHIAPTMYADPNFALKHLTQVVLYCRRVMERRSDHAPKPTRREQVAARHDRAALFGGVQ